jgi:catechol 2,3-dioxygenase-like lactoylglutathione lyase family enzyme
MAIIPILPCRSLRASLVFYTDVLDFQRTDDEDDPDKCSVIVLRRGDDRLCLATEDGAAGTVVVVTTDDVDGVFWQFRQRGLRTPGDPEAPRQVHEGPIDQTWGTREFYVEDPDGNTLRFTQ